MSKPDEETEHLQRAQESANPLSKPDPKTPPEDEYWASHTCNMTCSHIRPGNKAKLAALAAPSKPDQSSDWLDKILDNHRSETWATGWNNDATEKAKATIQSHLEAAIREAERRGILKATGDYSYTMPMKSARTRNTAFKLYAVKFFNSKIRERREALLLQLKNGCLTKDKEQS